MKFSSLFHVALGVIISTSCVVEMQSSQASCSSDDTNHMKESTENAPRKSDFKSNLERLRRAVFGDKESQKNASFSHEKKVDPLKGDVAGSGPLLHQLVKNGQIKKCIELVNQDSINECDEKKKTLLHLSIEIDNEELCRHLIQNGAELNHKDSDDNTPLQVACLKDNSTLGIMLIKAHASSNTYNKKGLTPLHIAAHSDNEKFSLLLLHEEADLSIGTLKEGDTPLHIAAALGKTKTLSLFLELGARCDIKNYAGKTALDLALENDNIDIARTLARNNRRLLIERAIYLKCPSILETLISVPLLWTDLVFSQGLNALHVLSVLPNDEQELMGGLSAGTQKVAVDDLSKEDNEKQERMIGMVLEKNRLGIHQPDNLGRTPLHFACEWNREFAAKLLLKRDPKKDWSVILRPSQSGYTPLMLAIAYNYPSLVQLLVDTLIKRVGSSSLVCLYPLLMCVAIDHTSLDVVKLLLSYKKKIAGDQEFEDEFLLHRACVIGDLAICSLLIEDCKDVNKPFIKERSIVSIRSPLPKDHEDDELTPLAYAADAGHLSIVQLLLTKGAQINSKSKLGKTPFLLAAKKNQTEVAVFLISSGAYLAQEDLECADAEICKLLATELKRRIDKVPLEQRGILKEQLVIDQLLGKKDSQGKTILQREAERGNPANCELILKFSGQMDIVDDEGRTPLHLACMVGPNSDRLRYDKPCKTVQVFLTHPKLTKELLEKRDSKGKTALDYASEGGNYSRVAIDFLHEAQSKLEASLAGNDTSISRQPIKWINEDNDPDNQK